MRMHVTRSRSQVLTMLGILMTTATMARAQAVFVNTGAMHEGRYEHVAARLQDGRVLVAGGWGVSGGGFLTSFASAELFDPETETWSVTGSMAEARNGALVAVLPSGKVLVAGGQDLASAEIYDPDTGTFPPTGRMMQARYGGVAVTLADGRVLLAGGCFCVPLRYSPSTGAFTYTAPMNAGRPHPTVTASPCRATSPWARSTPAAGSSAMPSAPSTTWMPAWWSTASHRRTRSSPWERRRCTAAPGDRLALGRPEPGHRQARAGVGVLLDQHQLWTDARGVDGDRDATGARTLQGGQGHGAGRVVCLRPDLRQRFAGAGGEPERAVESEWRGGSIGPASRGQRPKAKG
jgi:hypothetical protein